MAYQKLFRIKYDEYNEPKTMKTIYFETIDSPSAAIYKIYGVYPEAI